MPPRPTGFLNSHSGLIAPGQQHSGENRGDTAAQAGTWDVGLQRLSQILPGTLSFQGTQETKPGKGWVSERSLRMRRWHCDPPALRSRQAQSQELQAQGVGPCLAEFPRVLGAGACPVAQLPAEYFTWLKEPNRHLSSDS